MVRVAEAISALHEDACPILHVDGAFNERYLVGEHKLRVLGLCLISVFVLRVVLEAAQESRQKYHIGRNDSRLEFLDNDESMTSYELALTALVPVVQVYLVLASGCHNRQVNSRLIDRLQNELSRLARDDEQEEERKHEACLQKLPFIVINKDPRELYRHSDEDGQLDEDEQHDQGGACQWSDEPHLGKRIVSVRAVTRVHLDAHEPHDDGRREH